MTKRLSNILVTTLKIVAFGVVSFMFLQSCNETTNIPVIDLNSIDQSISLDLNDILKDISIVQISKDKLLHSVNDKIYVTSQYLIIYSDKFSKTNASMDLFNRKGELIRNLAVRGNGPGEFNIIENFFVDEHERILYYTDMRDRSILNRIEISNGVALELYDRKGNISKIDNTNVMNTKIDLTEPGTYIYSSLPIICGDYGYMLVEHDVLGTQKDIDPDNDNPIIITGKLK